MFSRAVLLVVALALAGCPAELEPADVDPDCTPQYEPTFANVFDNTLVPDCSPSGCHSGPVPKAGMDLSEIDVAHAELLDGRVIPGDPEHSELVMRIFTDDRSFLMPVGDPLSDAEQCAAALWVLGGAER